jgi:hypothetical protein
LLDASLRVDPDVVSLEGGRAERKAEVAEDGHLQVTVCRSSSAVEPDGRKDILDELVTAAQPRESNCNHAEFFAIVDGTPSPPTCASEGERDPRAVGEAPSAAPTSLYMVGNSTARQRVRDPSAVGQHLVRLLQHRR